MVVVDDFDVAAVGGWVDVVGEDTEMADNPGVSSVGDEQVEESDRGGGGGIFVFFSAAARKADVYNNEGYGSLVAGSIG